MSASGAIDAQLCMPVNSRPKRWLINAWQNSIQSKYHPRIKEDPISPQTEPLRELHRNNIVLWSNKIIKVRNIEI